MSANLRNRAHKYVDRARCSGCVCFVIDHSGRFYKHGLTIIPAWISNHTPNKVWDEITYPFQNFNGCTVEV